MQCWKVSGRRFALVFALASVGAGQLHLAVSDSAAGIGCCIAMSQDSVLLNKNANFFIEKLIKAHYLCLI
eukprot:g13032.t1